MTHLVSYIKTFKLHGYGQTKPISLQARKQVLTLLHLHICNSAYFTFQATWAAQYTAIREYSARRAHVNVCDNSPAVPRKGRKVKGIRWQCSPGESITGGTASGAFEQKGGERDLHHLFSFSQLRRPTQLSQPLFRHISQYLFRAPCRKERKNGYWKQLNSKEGKSVGLLPLHDTQVFHQTTRQENGWNSICSFVWLNLMK